MLQIIKHTLLENKDGKPISLRLIFANQSEKDIFMKDQLDTLAEKYPQRLSIEYIIDKSSNPTWKGPVGYIDKQLIGRYFPFPGLGSSIKIFVCGPPGMMKHVCGPKAPDYSQGELGGLLKELGYDSSQVFKF